LTVTSMELLRPAGQVWDFNVPRYHNYLAAKTIQHNSGKTWCGGAIAVALLRGLKELGGEKLPDVPCPCIGWCVVQTYKGQVDGAQAAVLHWLGEWPHKIVYGISEAKGWIDTLWVSTAACKHGMGEKCKTCSKLVFHCSESDSSIGGRVHFVWADEPPKKEVWDECRQRSTAKHLIARWITATPKERQWWWWMPSDFDGCEDRPQNGYVEIRSSMMDNKALVPKVLKQKLDAAGKDQRARAVIHGDYVDLKGECPFPPEKLEGWLRRCWRPTIEEITVSAERRTPEGDVIVPVRCRVEIYHEHDENETYLGVLDPATFLRLDPITGLVATDWTREGSSARGVPDPCGFHLYARRKPRLVVRFIGYSGAHGLGSLAGMIGLRYGNALLDTDLTGGHGDPAVRALTALRYYNLNNYSMLASAPGTGSTKLGFTMTGTNRAEMVAAIQVALLEDALMVESEACVRSLMAVTYVMTPSGRERPEASYGAKDEDMICMGRALHLMNTLPLPALKTITAEDKLSRLLGRRIRTLASRQEHRKPIAWSPQRR